ncbi:MAG: Ubiquinone/menaquinone biosynthesis C-methyltransferase UbiE [Turneriella sp.]|nr:Ubiquinone/menaquinone biosynthesis C-methyltransferase UbiE [Turneriella sp.]
MANNTPNALDSENLYASPLDLSEELPRLAAQARLLFTAQCYFIKNIKLPTSSENPKFIDLGAGPGIHLSLVTTLFPKFTFTGVELSDNLFEYARMNFPNIDWRKGSIYKIPAMDAQFDIAQASFIFIHLREPAIALAEIYRVLKPGGVLFILDVDDSTFKGTAEMEALVKGHLKIYEADRTIMSRMDSLSKAAGFTPLKQESVRVDNTGKEDAPQIDYPNVHLGKMTFWSMFTFMGQRTEITELYEKARSHYMASTNSTCEISIAFHAYKK